MIRLKEDGGIPRAMMIMMAAMAGLTVANLYYNQPLLEKICRDLGVSEVSANLITVITQTGYALGLCFLIPSGDLYSRRRLIIVSMAMAALMAVVIGFAADIYTIWAASVFLGAFSVVPQFFLPIATQFSRPGNKARNMGYVLSGLLVGILGARVVGGLVGEWLGWRSMFLIAAGIMLLCLIITLRMMPDMKRNFHGSYASLMKTVFQIFIAHPGIRVNSVRAAFGFGSLLTVWACLAFHLAKDFGVGSDMVGMLGLCGIAGAMVASGLGRYVPRFGVYRFSVAGGSIMIAGWLVALFLGNSYVGMAASIILLDIGLQCLQLSNQSASIAEIPSASNRVNTIFMTIYFVGGSLGTFLAGWGWKTAGWQGVCAVGIVMAGMSCLSA
ncbi:MFS transporter [Prevotella dentasini]|uniref:MFS transporter n=1 Tax=Prevotella dentasini TaxID=589537 RepID=UPI00046897C4|nr:MFS transporter [Prevotella dentasini]